MPVLANDPASKGAEAYRAFGKEFLKRARERLYAESLLASAATAAGAPAT